jgi:hypothetical protein
MARLNLHPKNVSSVRVSAYADWLNKSCPDGFTVDNPVDVDTDPAIALKRGFTMVYTADDDTAYQIRINVSTGLALLIKLSVDCDDSEYLKPIGEFKNDAGKLARILFA